MELELDMVSCLFFSDAKICRQAWAVVFSRYPACLTCWVGLSCISHMASARNQHLCRYPWAWNGDSQPGQRSVGDLEDVYTVLAHDPLSFYGLRWVVG
jgi:hypothetical protein